MRRLATIAALLAAGTLPAAAEELRAKEVTKTYAISGATGPELYASMGERGPVVGKSGIRTIAHTTFDLKWRRNYQPQDDGSCKLVSAKHWFTITYTLPKPSQKLPPSTAARWKVFIDGMTAHEKVHGDHMKQMLDTILATTIGLTVPGDPKCQKIKKEILAPLSAASEVQRRQSREFDEAEMSDGGNVHRLILGLVNGD